MRANYLTYFRSHQHLSRSECSLVGGETERHIKKCKYCVGTHQVRIEMQCTTYSVTDRSKSQFICYQCWMMLPSIGIISPAFNLLRLSFPNTFRAQALVKKSATCQQTLHSQRGRTGGHPATDTTAGIEQSIQSYSVTCKLSSK